ncbi:MAG: hypothetical protein K0S34_2099 [Bacillales bacterium]|nr:hypothetical protein [Bacillales bacterium]
MLNNNFQTKKYDKPRNYKRFVILFSIFRYTFFTKFHYYNLILFNFCLYVKLLNLRNFQGQCMLIYAFAYFVVIQKRKWGRFDGYIKEDRASPTGRGKS